MFVDPMSIHRAIFIALWLTATVYALARGGGPERCVTIALLIAGIASSFARPTSGLVAHLDRDIFTIDLLLLVVLLAVALRADRRWTLLMAAFQVLIVLGHLAPLLDADLNRRVYLTLVIGWSYPMLLLLIAGTWRHRRRLRLAGPERDWLPWTSVRSDRFQAMENR